MKKALLGLILAGGSIFAGPRVSIGFSFGGPPPVAYARPAYPGPGYDWIDGYYDRGSYVQGYWRAPVRVYSAPRWNGHDRDNFRRNDRDGRFDRDRNRHDNRDFGRGYRR